MENLTWRKKIGYYGRYYGTIYTVPRQGNQQRGALGLESYVYTFMRKAGCAKIIQWGFDETSIDGHETLNQWAMLMDGDENGETLDAPTTVVTLECAALLPGSEAEEVVEHIEQVWKRGKLAIDRLLTGTTRT
jgi:hypothetical protein